MPTDVPTDVPVDLRIAVDTTLTFLPAPRRRALGVDVTAPPTDTPGHLVESVGVPLTEVGALVHDGVVAAPDNRPGGPSPPPPVHAHRFPVGVVHPG